MGDEGGLNVSLRSCCTLLVMKARGQMLAAIFLLCLLWHPRQKTPIESREGCTRGGILCYDFHSSLWL